MSKVETKEEVLKCVDCGEFMHARVVSENFLHKGKNARRFRQEVFCPNCNKPQKIRNQYKMQKDEQKKRESKLQ